MSVCVLCVYGTEAVGVVTRAGRAGRQAGMTAVLLPVCVWHDVCWTEWVCAHTHVYTVYSGVVACGAADVCVCSTLSSACVAVCVCVCP